MRAFQRASSGVVDPIKIQKWIRRWMDDGPANNETPGKKDEIRAVELIHLATSRSLSAWEVNRRTSIPQLANEIAERAKEDATGLGDERAKFMLQPYFGNSGTPNGSATFFVQVQEPHAEDDGGEITEGPTNKGERQMLMRHANEAVKLALGGAQHGLFTLQEENSRLRDECQTLRGELRDMGEKVRQYENESFERAIKWRKTLFWEKAREEALKQVIPFIGMAGGAMLQKFGMLGMGGSSGALPPAKPQPAAAPTHVNVAPGAGFPIHPTPPPPPPDASASTANGGTGPTAGGSMTSEGVPTIEARLRRLWKALQLPQKMALPLALAKHPSIGPLQKAAGQKIVELLMGPTESPRGHQDGVSLLEAQAQGLFGTFTDVSWTQLMDILLKEARWSPEHIAILTGIVRDLGKRDRAFDASIAAPFPAPPEPISPSGMEEDKDKPKPIGPPLGAPKTQYDPVPRTPPVQPETPSKVPVVDMKTARPVKGTGRAARGPASSATTAPMAPPAARAMPVLPSGAGRSGRAPSRRK